MPVGVVYSGSNLHELEKLPTKLDQRTVPPHSGADDDAVAVLITERQPDRLSAVAVAHVQLIVLLESLSRQHILPIRTFAP